MRDDAAVEIGKTLEETRKRAIVESHYSPNQPKLATEQNMTAITIIDPANGTSPALTPIPFSGDDVPCGPAGL